MEQNRKNPPDGTRGRRAFHRPLGQIAPEVQSLETFLGYLEANGAQAICAATFNTMLTEWPECVATESNPRTTQTYVSSRPSLPEQV